MPGNRPRWILHMQAQFWRVLMGIGMALHRLARPLPPSPSFSRYVDATVSPLKGKFRLQFYVPKDYYKQKKLKSNKRYPCVINFHGGGFVLGTAKDDARWSGVVVQEVGAVVVSVDYRLAPEWPFPTAVEDGADALLYLSEHANELMLDPTCFALSGFSSGGNMAFTVPLCLQGELFERTPSGTKIEDGRAGNVPEVVNVPSVNPEPPQGLTPNSSRVPLVRQKSHLSEAVDVPSNIPETQALTPALTPNPSRPSSSRGQPLARQRSHLSEVIDVPSNIPETHGLTPNASRVPLVHQKSRLDRLAMLRQTGTSSLSLVSSYKEGPAVNVTAPGQKSVVKIRGLVSFYPPTDYTVTRAQRRATCARTDQQLPAVFTELFDDSYLQPPSLDLAHPWLSPGVAPTRMLVALPDDIVLFCCEWDMLRAEGQRFRDRLAKDLGKRVHYHCVPGVPHGWDKAPNPIRETPGAREQYLVACKELKRMFEIDEEDEEECVGCQHEF